MFIESPASKLSLSNRSLIHGIGINDADYITFYRGIDGKPHKCPYYVKWSSMLERCYSERYQAKRASYKGCSVTKGWLLFSNFKSWMSKQDWMGKQLDKDILSQGNKIYSPEKCLFVTQKINTLLCDCRASKGQYKTGVYLCGKSSKYRAMCCVDGKRKSIGSFRTEHEAFEAYKRFKYELIKSIAIQQVEPLKTALLNYEIQ